MAGLATYSKMNRICTCMLDLIACRQSCSHSLALGFQPSLPFPISFAPQHVRGIHATRLWGCCEHQILSARACHQRISPLYDIMSVLLAHHAPSRPPRYSLCHTTCQHPSLTHNLTAFFSVLHDPLGFTVAESRYCWASTCWDNPREEIREEYEVLSMLLFQYINTYFTVNNINSNCFSIQWKNYQSSAESAMHHLAPCFLVFLIVANLGRRRILSLAVEITVENWMFKNRRTQQPLPRQTILKQ